MSYNTNPKSIRLGKSIYWNNNNFLNFNKNLWFFLELKLRNYIKGVLAVLTGDHDVLKKRHYSKLSLSFLSKSTIRMPIMLGDIFFYFKNDTIFIDLNYFFDLKNTHYDKIQLLKLKLKNLSLNLSKILNTNVVINQLNYYELVLHKSVFSSFNKTHAKHNSNFFYYNDIKYNDYLFKFYDNVKTYYFFFTNKVSKYRSNRYFYRIINVFFSSFLLRKIDFNIIVNAISFELRTLRKQHRRFIYFVSDVLKNLFDIFGKYHFLSGLKLVIKGREIPYNRERQRAGKKVISIGRLPTTSNIDFISYTESSNSYPRFGSINVSLTVTKFKKNHTLSLLTSPTSPSFDYQSKNLSIYNYFYNLKNFFL